MVVEPFPENRGSFDGMVQKIFNGQSGAVLETEFCFCVFLNSVFVCSFCFIRWRWPFAARRTTGFVKSYQAESYGFIAFGRNQQAFVSPSNITFDETQMTVGTDVGFVVSTNVHGYVAADVYLLPPSLPKPVRPTQLEPVDVGVAVERLAKVFRELFGASAPQVVVSANSHPALQRAAERAQERDDFAAFLFAGPTAPAGLRQLVVKIITGIREQHQRAKKRKLAAAVAIAALAHDAASIKLLHDCGKQGCSISGWSAQQVQTFLYQLVRSVQHIISTYEDSEAARPKPADWVPNPYRPRVGREAEANRLHYVFGFAHYRTISSCLDDQAVNVLHTLEDHEKVTFDPARQVKRTSIILKSAFLEGFCYLLEGALDTLFSEEAASTTTGLTYVRESIVYNNHLHTAWKGCIAALDTEDVNLAKNVLDLLFVRFVATYLRSRQKSWRVMRGWIPQKVAALRASLRPKAETAAAAFRKHHADEEDTEPSSAPTGSKPSKQSATTGPKRAKQSATASTSSTDAAAAGKRQKRKSNAT
jgi:hypothetical protein